jgi:hypothetical protein
MVVTIDVEGVLVTLDLFADSIADAIAVLQELDSEEEDDKDEV